jgi:two-component system LytT family response regulator
VDEALKKIKDTIVEHTSLMAGVIEKNLHLPVKKKKLTTPTGRELLFLNIEDIVHCHSDINYTTIYKKDNQIHNSDLINLDCIKSYNKGKGGSVHLNDGTEQEVSTRRKDEFLKKNVIFIIVMLLLLLLHHLHIFPVRIIERSIFI